MTRLLLDFPWTVDKLLGPDPAPQKVFLDFINLRASTNLKSVGFIDQEEENEFNKILNDKNRVNRRDNRLTTVIMNLQHLRGGVSGDVRARPTTDEPSGLRESWKCALGTELGDLSDWRNPQIIVPKVRRSDWHCGDEVEINCDPSISELSSSQHLRVLAVLEEYESHPFALSDLDPWNLERIHPPAPDRDRQHPALLPKPPMLNGSSLENLRAHLVACDADWEIGGNYYFIPPNDFDPLKIDKERWRKGRAFRYQTASNSADKNGPVDYEGRVWCWDECERHWDVQFSQSYWRISHTGHRL